MLNMLLSHLCWTSQTWGRTLSEEGTSSRIVLKVLAAAVAPEGTMAWMSRNFWPLLRSTPVRNRMQSRANSAGSFDSTCDWWIIPFFPCYQFCQESSVLGTSLFWPDIIESWTLLLPHTPCLVFSCSMDHFYSSSRFYLKTQGDDKKNHSVTEIYRLQSTHSDENRLHSRLSATPLWWTLQYASLKSCGEFSCFTFVEITLRVTMCCGAAWIVCLYM